MRATRGRKYQRSFLQEAGDCVVLSPHTGTSRVGGQSHLDAVKDEGEQVGQPLHLPMGPQPKETRDTKFSERKIKNWGSKSPEPLGGEMAPLHTLSVSQKELNSGSSPDHSPSGLPHSRPELQKREDSLSSVSEQRHSCPLRGTVWAGKQMSRTRETREGFFLRQRSPLSPLGVRRWPWKSAVDLALHRFRS